MSRPFRPVLAGNSHASLYVLDLLLEVWSPDDVLVVAAPDTRKHDWQPSLAERAEHLGVPFIAPQDVNAPEVVQQLTDRQSDLLLSVYYTQIFKAPLLDAVDGPKVNFHPALLPKHRGTAPLIWAIADGDTMAGLSVHDIALGIDTGDLLWQRLLPIHPDDTGYTLHMKAAALTRATAAELIRRLDHGLPLPEPRRQTGAASHHSRRDPQLNHIDWELPSVRVRNIVRALAAPLPGAYTTIRSVRIGLERVEPGVSRGPARPPGMVELNADGDPTIWSSDGPVAIDAVRVDGAIEPAVAAFRALGIHEGDFAA